MPVKRLERGMNEVRRAWPDAAEAPLSLRWVRLAGNFVAKGNYGTR